VDFRAHVDSGVFGSVRCTVVGYDTSWGALYSNKQTRKYVV